MAAIFNSPSKYILGPDELAKLGSYVEPLGAKALVIVTPSGKKRVGAKIEGGFAEAKAELLFEDFNGECSKGEVDRLVALATWSPRLSFAPPSLRPMHRARHFRCSTPMTASSINISSLRQTPTLS